MFLALERAWPVPRRGGRGGGGQKDKDCRALTAYRLSAAGESVSEVADALCVEHDRAQRLINHGEVLYNGPSDDESDPFRARETLRVSA
jgi:hypothetical protein